MRPAATIQSPTHGYISLSEAISVYGVHRTTLLRWIRTGVLTFAQGETFIFKRERFFKGEAIQREMVALAKRGGL